MTEFKSDCPLVALWDEELLLENFNFEKVRGLPVHVLRNDFENLLH